MQIEIATFPHLKDNESRRAVERSKRRRMSAMRETEFRTWTPEELAYNEAKESLTNG